MSIFSRFSSSRQLFKLIKDLKNGGYRRLSKNSILMILAGLIYLILPTDVVVDAIPILGLIDDATIFAFILKQIKKDLNR